MPEGPLYGLYQKYGQERGTDLSLGPSSSARFQPRHTSCMHQQVSFPGIMALPPFQPLPWAKFHSYWSNRVSAPRKVTGILHPVTVVRAWSALPDSLGLTPSRLVNTVLLSSPVLYKKATYSAFVPSNDAVCLLWIGVTQSMMDTTCQH